MTNCPYLGLYSDPKSHFDIPTSANCCHKSDPVGSVKRSYQETACFSEAYHSCPVFQQEWQGALPPEARGSRVRKPIRAKYLWLGFIVIVIVLVGLGVNVLLGKPEMLAWFSGSRDATETLATQVEPIAVADTPFVTRAPSTETPSPTASSTKTKLPTLTSTSVEAKPHTVTATDVYTTTSPPPSASTAIPATATISFSPTPAQENRPYTPGPQFRTPFGPQDAYVLHHISEGESFPKISDLYNTNNDMIIALNAWVSETGLWPNKVIVIMPGKTDSLDVEPLSVTFTQAEITASEFAASQGVTIEEVRFYNDLGVDETIPAGRWLIFPYNPETLTPSPTEIPTPDLSKALTGPFGPHDEYVLHRLVSGESMPALEKRYLTTTEVIRATNVIISSIWEGQVLVIMPGQTETINIPKFSVLKVDETISIEALASDLGVLYADILYYNNLKQGEDIPAGRWIIYPYIEETP